jgi:hypothetical protein
MHSDTGNFHQPSVGLIVKLPAVRWSDLADVGTFPGFVQCPVRVCGLPNIASISWQPFGVLTFPPIFTLVSHHEEAYFSLTQFCCSLSTTAASNPLPTLYEISSCLACLSDIEKMPNRKLIKDEYGQPPI